MIEINLAPGAENRRAARRSRASFALPSVPALGGGAPNVGVAGAALLAVLVVGFAFWRQGAHQAELEQRIVREAADSTRFATTIGLITSLQARQDTIQQQIGVIREVDQRRFVWPHLLDEISRATPQYTWLTEITSAGMVAAAPQAAVRQASAERAGSRSRAEEKADTTATPAAMVPNFSLQGHAGSTPALTRFMKNLEASAFIRDVTLVTSEQVDQDGRTIHRFTLEARYEVPAPGVIETVPVVMVN